MFSHYKKITKTSILVLFCVCLTLFVKQVVASEAGEWTSEVGLESTFYAEASDTSDTRSNYSLVMSTEYFEDWNDGADSFTFSPRARLDQHDPERNTFDISELSWVHVEDTWEIRTGVREVSWGVSFMGSVVDVINQTSLAEDLFGAKLGQPMVNLSLVRDWGILDLYVLAGFREASLPGTKSRPGLPFELNTDESQIPLGNQSIYGLDYATRWQHSWESLEWAVSWFHGTNRSPDIDFNYNVIQPGIISTYYQIDQLGIELNYIWNGYNFKYESATVDGAKYRGDDIGIYTAGLLGFEYTWGSAFGSKYDVMWDVSYMHDDRKDSITAILEKDVFLIGTLNFNDEFDTRLTLGTIQDTHDNEGIFLVNASRRIAESWKLDLSGIFFYVDKIDTSPEVTRQQSQAEFERLLRDYQLFGDSDLEKIIDSLGGLIVDYGVNSPEVATAIDNLQVIVDNVSLRSDNKLGMLEDESFVRLMLTHYF